MKLITPQFTELAVLDGASLEQYLNDEQLVVKKSQLSQVGVAFPMEMLQLVNDVISGQIECVTSNDLVKLAKDVESSIQANELVTYAPRHREMRQFYDTQGFCRAMSEVSKKISNGVVVLPAGLYGDRHMIVWKRVAETAGQ